MLVRDAQAVLCFLRACFGAAHRSQLKDRDGFGAIRTIQ
jgi:hypothetical protein